MRAKEGNLFKSSFFGAEVVVSAKHISSAPKGDSSSTVELQIGRVAAPELVWWSRSPPKHALSRGRLGETVKSQRVSRGTLRSRVHLTGGNRPYRPEPVTVPVGYQPVGSKNFEFEFQKLKIVENP
jgi:hypothetical protein